MRRWMLYVLALLLAMGAVVGCGDDDDDEPGAAFCDKFLALNEGEPTPKQIRAVGDLAPKDARADFEAIASGFEKDGEGYFETSEFGERFSAVNNVAADECADDRIEVTATEYKFTGIPSSIDAGIIAVDFENKGGEFHEMAVARKKDGVDKSFDEILGLGEEEAEKFVDHKGGAFSEPGQSTVGIFDVSEPGDYVALCFLPKGSTPENENADGPPHFTEGMKVEFSVE